MASIDRNKIIDKDTKPKATQYNQKLKDNNQIQPIKGIATSGEFKGFELENGMPSYEATKSMTDQEFKAYEKKYLMDEVDNETSALDHIRSFAAQGATPFTVKFGAAAYDSVRKLKDQYQKDSGSSMIEDVGNGTMSRLAAPFSKTSSDWWKDRLNTKDGEASNIGTNIADEAMMGLVGGAIGKGLGTVYKGMKRSGEMYSHRIKKLAKQAEEIALSNPGFRRIRPNADTIKDRAALVRQNAYDNMTKIPKVNFNLTADAIAHNVQRKLGSRSMLNGNNNELNSLYEQVGSLNKARKAQRANWDQLPGQGMKIGTTVGLGGGMLTGGNGGAKESKASNANLSKPWVSGTGVGSMGKLKSTGTDGI